MIRLSRESMETNFRKYLETVFEHPEIISAGVRNIVINRENIREKYPPGTAVEVVEFHDQYRDIPAGTKGRVLAVDDTGTIHCEFENGVSLGALWGIDVVKKID